MKRLLFRFIINYLQSLFLFSLDEKKYFKPCLVNFKHQFDLNDLKGHHYICSCLIIALMRYGLKPSPSALNKTLKLGGPIAQWNCLRLPICGPGFDSKAQHLHFDFSI